MGIYNFEKIAERLLKKLESLPEGSEEYKRTLYAYKKFIGQQPTFKNKQNVADYISNLSPSVDTIDNEINANVDRSEYQDPRLYAYKNLGIGMLGVAESIIDNPPGRGPGYSGQREVAEAEKRGEYSTSPYSVANKDWGSSKNIQIGDEYPQAQKSKWQEYLDWRNRRSIEDRIDDAWIAEQPMTAATATFKGGDATRQAIAQQALALRGEGDLTFGPRESGYAVGRSAYEPTASSVPGGSFSAASVSNLGRDQTPEAVQQFLSDYASGETQRRINMIEQAAPPQYRSKETQAYLGMLYEKKAEEDKALAMRMEAEASQRTADAYVKQAEAQAEYYKTKPEVEAAGDILNYESNIARYASESKQKVYEVYKPMLESMLSSAESSADPNAIIEARAKYNSILVAIAHAKSPEEAFSAVAALLDVGPEARPGISAVGQATSELPGYNNLFYGP